MTQPSIIVHGGAGDWKDERIPIGMEFVEKAAKIGFRVLENGGSALDAAETITVFMENSGQLNAGLGATTNLDGERELDAMIVDGQALDFGAVAAVIGVQNPISLARYIMEKTPYSFFSGENAKKLYFQMLEEGYRVEKDDRIVMPEFDGFTADTVGCVVLDAKGHFAASSSTGGIKMKIPGRIGDSPVFGSGAYANDICGVTATGYGEHIMRVTLSRLVAFILEKEEDVQKATDQSMSEFESKTHSEAGVIALDSKGNYGKSTNAKAMPTTVIQGSYRNIHSFER